RNSTIQNHARMLMDSGFTKMQRHHSFQLS
ncbi:MAG: hypothetical protein ACI83I_001923, partial [Bacteroidia bacterium]